MKALNLKNLAEINFGPMEKLKDCACAAEKYLTLWKERMHGILMAREK